LDNFGATRAYGKIRHTCLLCCLDARVAHLT